MIYWSPPSVRLVDFCERLVTQYTTNFKEEVKTLPNKPISTLGLDKKLNYLQVIAVEPYFPTTENREALTGFARHHCVNEFYIETPYSPSGKISDDVDKQWKVRTVFQDSKYFPSMLLRHPVTDERAELLEPLSSAIDLIASRVAALKKEMDQTPNTKTLQIVLQGSIMLQVNAGPLAICKVFLSRADDYPPEKIALLKKLMVDFFDEMFVCFSVKCASY